MCEDAMAEFNFVTTWQIAAPLAAVCDAVSECRCWPRWWRGVEKVEEIEPGDENGIGSLRRFTWRASCRSPCWKAAPAAKWRATAAGVSPTTAARPACVMIGVCAALAGG